MFDFAAMINAVWNNFMLEYIIIGKLIIEKSIF